MDLPADIMLITRNGRPFWREISTGREVPRIAGGNGDQPVPPVPPTPPDAPPTFTQADIDAAIAKAAADKQTEIETTLGAPIADAATVVGGVAAAIEAQKSDTQRDQEAAAKALAEANQIKADAARERQGIAIEGALRAAGIALPADPTAAAAAIGQAAALVTVTADADPATIAAAVDTVKTTFPGLFTTQATPPPTGFVPGSNPPPNPPASGTAEERAEATRARLFPFRKTAA